MNRKLVLIGVLLIVVAVGYVGYTRALAPAAAPKATPEPDAAGENVIWASGKVVVNAWLAIPSGFSAEVIAQCGFDSVTVDMQHGVQDYQSMIQCF